MLGRPSQNMGGGRPESRRRAATAELERKAMYHSARVLEDAGSNRCREAIEPTRGRVSRGRPRRRRRIEGGRSVTIWRDESETSGAAATTIEPTAKLHEESSATPAIVPGRSSAGAPRWASGWASRRRRRRRVGKRRTESVVLFVAQRRERAGGLAVGAPGRTWNGSGERRGGSKHPSKTIAGRHRARAGRRADRRRRTSKGEGQRIGAECFGDGASKVTVGEAREQTDRRARPVLDEAECTSGRRSGGASEICSVATLQRRPNGIGARRGGTEIGPLGDRRAARVGVERRRMQPIVNVRGQLASSFVVRPPRASERSRHCAPSIASGSRPTTMARASRRLRGVPSGEFQCAPEATVEYARTSQPIAPECHPGAMPGRATGEPHDS